MVAGFLGFGTGFLAGVASVSESSGAASVAGSSAAISVPFSAAPLPVPVASGAGAASGSASCAAGSAASIDVSALVFTAFGGSAAVPPPDAGDACSLLLVLLVQLHLRLFLLQISMRSGDHGTCNTPRTYTN
ncbi:hypothetical protein ACOSQ2_016734 [Xanthoceras sorbifolium]